MPFKPYRFLHTRQSCTYILPSPLTISLLPPTHILLKPSIIVSPLLCSSTSSYFLMNIQPAIQWAVRCFTLNFLHTPRHSFFFLLARLVRVQPTDQKQKYFLYITPSRYRRLTAADVSSCWSRAQSIEVFIHVLGFFCFLLLFVLQKSFRNQIRAYSKILFWRVHLSLFRTRWWGERMRAVPRKRHMRFSFKPSLQKSVALLNLNYLFS